jgi:hypothetical protein
VPATQADHWAPKPAHGDWVRRMWGVWAVAVAVNVAIWLILVVTTGDFIYPWPLWVAGPWGAVLLVSTIFGRGQGGSKS